MLRREVLTTMKFASRGIMNYLLQVNIVNRKRGISINFQIESELLVHLLDSNSI